MSNKKYYWLKLKTDFFNQREIKKLRKIAGGDTYTIIYLKLQLLCTKTDGIIKFEGTERNLEEQLELELDEDLDNIKVTLSFLEANGLIEQITDNDYLMPKVCSSIGKEGSSAERVRTHRAKKALHCNKQVTNSNTEIEIEIEREIEIEVEKKQVDLSLLSNTKKDYSTFIDELFKNALIKTKVTKGRGNAGYEAYIKIQDKKKLHDDYLLHQINEKNFAKTITNYMIDYEAICNGLFKSNTYNPNKTLQQKNKEFLDNYFNRNFIDSEVIE